MCVVQVFSPFVFSGTSDEVPAFGSLHYWFRLKLPMTETIHLYKEKVKAVDYIHSTLSQDTQVAKQTFPLQ